MRFDPLSQTMDQPAPAAKPARPARRRADKPAAAAAPAPIPATKPARRAAAKMVDVRSIPLNTYAMLVADGTLGYDTLAELRAAFGDHCERHPEPDWRTAWRAFRNEPPPPADAGPATNVIPLPATPPPDPEPPCSPAASAARAFLLSL